MVDDDDLSMDRFYAEGGDVGESDESDDEEGFDESEIEAFRLLGEQMRERGLTTRDLFGGLDTGEPINGSPHKKATIQKTVPKTKEKKRAASSKKKTAIRKKPKKKK